MIELRTVYFLFLWFIWLTVWTYFHFFCYQGRCQFRRERPDISSTRVFDRSSYVKWLFNLFSLVCVCNWTVNCFLSIKWLIWVQFICLLFWKEKYRGRPSKLRRFAYNYPMQENSGKLGFYQIIPNRKTRENWGFTKLSITG